MENSAWATPLRTLDPADDDLSDLEPLRDIVGDARVVAIGESTHRIHEFYQVRHRLTRFLVERMGFTGYAMESGFPEGLTVDDWVNGGDGDLDALLHTGICYHMGKCEEMRWFLSWLRAYNAGGPARPVRFMGLDIADSSASALPAVQAVLPFLDDVDRPYADHVRHKLLPLFDYLPADRTGLAWAAPTIQAFVALDAARRDEISARIGDLCERLLALSLVYIGRSSAEQYAVAFRCAETGRHTDAFLRGIAASGERTYEGWNIRDAAMAANVEWLLEREEKVIVTAANGHVQRWPFSAPPIVNEPLTMLGEYLEAALGPQMVVIGSAFGGGELFLHRAVPGGRPGQTETYTQELTELDPDSLDGLLADIGMPPSLIDLRRLPPTLGAQVAAAKSVMTGSQATPVNVPVGFDAIAYVGKVTPWHHFPLDAAAG